MKQSKNKSIRIKLELQVDGRLSSFSHVNGVKILHTVPTKTPPSWDQFLLDIQNKFGLKDIPKDSFLKIVTKHTGHQICTVKDIREDDELLVRLLKNDAISRSEATEKQKTKPSESEDFRVREGYIFKQAGYMEQGIPARWETCVETPRHQEGKKKKDWGDYDEEEEEEEAEAEAEEEDGSNKKTSIKQQDFGKEQYGTSAMYHGDTNYNRQVRSLSMRKTQLTGNNRCRAWIDANGPAVEGTISKRNWVKGSRWNYPERLIWFTYRKNGKKISIEIPRGDGVTDGIIQGSVSRFTVEEEAAEATRLRMIEEELERKRSLPIVHKLGRGGGARIVPVPKTDGPGREQRPRNAQLLFGTDEPSESLYPDHVSPSAQRCKNLTEEQILMDVVDTEEIEEKVSENTEIGGEFRPDNVIIEEGRQTDG